MNDGRKGVYNIFTRPNFGKTLSLDRAHKVLGKLLNKTLI